MKKTEVRALAAVMALCLLAGCKGSGDVPDTEDKQTQEIQTQTQDGEDTSAIFQVTGLHADDTVATVDGKAVTAETYLFLLMMGTENMLYSGQLSMEEDWTQADKDSIMDMTLKSATLFWTIQNKAAELGVTLSAEQEAEIQTQMQSLEENMGGAEAFQRELDAICMTRDGYEAVMRVNYLDEALREKLAEDGQLTATEEEVEKYISDQGIYAAKHILLQTREVSEDGSSYEDFSDEEKAKVLEKANELYAQLEAADDKEALFDRLRDEHSEDGRDGEGNLAYPEYNYIYPGQMVSEFEEGTLALAEGEISPPIQSDFGYHIIMRIPVDRETARSEYEESGKYGELQEQWMAEAAVETTGICDTLDPQKYYSDLTAFRQKLMEEQSAAEQTQPAQPQESPAE